MKLIIDIPKERYKWIIQRVAENENEPTYLPDLLHIIANGTPFDSVIEEYVERGAITENMIMLDKIDSIKAEIQEKISHYDHFQGSNTANGLNIALEIIDKHISGKENE